jgi:hypothetical protein
MPDTTGNTSVTTSEDSGTIGNISGTAVEIPGNNGNASVTTSKGSGTIGNGYGTVEEMSGIINFDICTCNFVIDKNNSIVPDGTYK